MKKIVINCETGNAEEIDDPEWTEALNAEENTVIQNTTNSNILSNIINLQQQIIDLTLLQNKLHSALITAINNDINVPAPSFDGGTITSSGPEGKYISTDHAKAIFEQEIAYANKLNKRRINEILGIESE